MQFLSNVGNQVAEFTKENATLLLTAGGVVGTVATAVLAGRGGMKYEKVLLEKKGEIYADQFGEFEKQDNPLLGLDQVELPKKEMLLMAVPHFIAPVVLGAATITMIITSHRMSSAKIAGLAAAYGLAERNLSEYKGKVAEKLTGPKKTQITDELAQEAVDRTSGHETIVVIGDQVLCFDKPSGRYFQSTMEDIRSAVNATNTEIHQNGFVQASDFYKKLKLPATAWSDLVGFDMDNPVELTFSTVEAPGNRPCLAFEFVRDPTTDFNAPKYN